MAYRLVRSFVRSFVLNVREGKKEGGEDSKRNRRKASGSESSSPRERERGVRAYMSIRLTRGSTPAQMRVMPANNTLARSLEAAFPLCCRGNPYEPCQALSFNIHRSTRIQCIFSCPSPPLCSGSNLISVSILMIAMHASTALFNCFTLLMLGSNTPILTMSAVLPLDRSSP